MKKDVPERKTYHIQCKVCDYKGDFHLGISENEENLNLLAERDIMEGVYGDDAKHLFINDLEAIATSRRELYKCRYCGNIETRLKVRILTNTIQYVPSYFCSQCDKMLTQVRPADRKRLPCPKCGSITECTGISNWDEAPVPKK